MGASETILQCPKCGTKTKDPLCPKCGHSFVASGTTIKAALSGLVAGASCILGHDWFGCKCKRCGKVRDEQHAFQPVEGKCEKKCSVCGKTKEIPHTWKGDLWNGKECTLCGSTQKPAYKRGGFWGIVGGVLLVLIVMAAGIGSDKTSEPSDGIRLPSSASEYKTASFDKDYLDMVKEFEDKGFTNIELKPLGDLSADSLAEDGSIEKIRVAGEEPGNVFLKKFPRDVRIVITYHSFPVTSEENLATTTTPAKDSTADWRQFLKDYEAWVDRYNVIIKKLNAGDLTVWADYFIMMEKLDEWDESEDEWEDALSKAEYAEFYPEYVRITAKMLVALYEID